MCQATVPGRDETRSSYGGSACSLTDGIRNTMRIFSIMRGDLRTCTLDTWPLKRLRRRLRRAFGQDHQAPPRRGRGRSGAHSRASPARPHPPGAACVARATAPGRAGAVRACPAPRRRRRRAFPFKPQPVASPLHEWSPRDQTSCDVCGAAAAAAAAEDPEPQAWSGPAFPVRSARPAQAASSHSGPGAPARPAPRGLGAPAPPRPGLGPPGPQCGG